MINLIPTHARKTVKTEYLIRTASVWLILLGLAQVGVVILHIPVWVLLNSQHDLLLGTYPNAEAQAADVASAEATVTATNELARILSVVPTDPSLIALFELVDSYTTSQISLQRFSVVREDDAVVSKFVISGIAARREDLANFQATLKSEPRFSEVTLPISNLAKGEDLPFTIDVTVLPPIVE